MNPRIGSRSDRTESRWGPRRPWMLAGGLALPPLFGLVFAGPGTPPGLAAGWVAVAFLLAATIVDARLEMVRVGGGKLPERMALGQVYRP